MPRAGFFAMSCGSCCCCLSFNPAFVDPTMLRWSLFRFRLINLCAKFGTLLLGVYLPSWPSPPTLASTFEFPNF
uniref:Putative secreted protein n=1 Tax=Anopheles darlingi TaxID=43151 RepID=A0A2M4DMR0_ANODA